METDEELFEPALNSMDNITNEEQNENITEVRETNSRPFTEPYSNSMEDVVNEPNPAGHSEVDRANLPSQEVREPAVGSVIQKGSENESSSTDHDISRYFRIICLLI